MKYKLITHNDSNILLYSFIFITMNIKTLKRNVIVVYAST